MKANANMQVEEILIRPVAEPETNPFYRDEVATKEFDPVFSAGTVLRQLFRYAEDMHNLVQERARLQAELLEARRETLARLAMVAAQATPGGAAPMMRIGLLAALVAHDLGLSEDYCDDICMAAPLRDIGMLALQGGNPLLPAQAGKDESDDGSRQHPFTGAALLGDADSFGLRMAEEVAFSHHERYSGGGYPRGLSKGDIPLSARIVAVVEAFDARMQEQATSFLDVVAELRMAAGVDFDPGVVEALAKRAASYRSLARLVEESLENPRMLPAFIASLPKLWRRSKSS